MLIGAEKPKIVGPYLLWTVRHLAGYPAGYRAGYPARHLAGYPAAYPAGVGVKPQVQGCA